MSVGRPSMKACTTAIKPTNYKGHKAHEENALFVFFFVSFVTFVVYLSGLQESRVILRSHVDRGRHAWPAEHEPGLAVHRKHERCRVADVDAQFIARLNLSTIA